MAFAVISCIILRHFGTVVHAGGDVRLCTWGVMKTRNTEYGIAE